MQMINQTCIQSLQEIHSTLQPLMLTFSSTSIYQSPINKTNFKPTYQLHCVFRKQVEHEGQSREILSHIRLKVITPPPLLHREDINDPDIIKQSIGTFLRQLAGLWKELGEELPLPTWLRQKYKQCERNSKQANSFSHASIDNQEYGNAAFDMLIRQRGMWSPSSGPARFTPRGRSLQNKLHEQRMTGIIDILIRQRVRVKGLGPALEMNAISRLRSFLLANFDLLCLDLDHSQPPQQSQEGSLQQQQESSVRQSSWSKVVFLLDADAVSCTVQDKGKGRYIVTLPAATSKSYKDRELLDLLTKELPCATPSAMKAVEDLYWNSSEGSIDETL